MVDAFEKQNQFSETTPVSAKPSPYDFLFQKEEFRPITTEEVKHAPLYCVGCRRLLAEAEVYGFRRGGVSEIRCWCGAQGRPLAKQDAKHRLAVEKAKNGGQRARALAVASQVFPGGKNKQVAGLLALFLGSLGAHKFYLGETVTGILYLLWFWTLIPLIISIYEAINFFQMSLVNFNMNYNLDIVLSQIEPQEKVPDKSDIFFS